MKLNLLYEKAKALGIEDEEVDEVLLFVKYASPKGERGLSLCGMCELRNTNDCPWPNKSSINTPSCFDYRKKRKL